MKTGTTMAMGLLLFAAGCGGRAASVGADPGGKVHLTQRGAEIVVAERLEATTEATRAAFRRWNVDETALEIGRDDTKRTLVGRVRGRDVEVTVEMERRGEERTHVEAYAREGLVAWDKRLAHGVIEAIVETATGRPPAPARTIGLVGDAR